MIKLFLSTVITLVLSAGISFADHSRGYGHYNYNHHSYNHHHYGYGHYNRFNYGFYFGASPYYVAPPYYPYYTPVPTPYYVPPPVYPYTDAYFYYRR